MSDQKWWEQTDEELKKTMIATAEYLNELKKKYIPQFKYQDKDLTNCSHGFGKVITVENGIQKANCSICKAEVK
jgi:hypothetical protein